MRRRHFIAVAPFIAAAALEAGRFPFGKRKMRLAYSTLGCPKWSLEQALDCAHENGYKGIEIRGLQGQLDLPKCPDFSTPERTAAARKMAEDRGVRIVNLGASAQLHHTDEAKRRPHMDEAKRFIALAGALNCPFVRVFPNDLPPDQEEKATLDLIAKGLQELGDYAKPYGVQVLLESHGKIVDSARLLHIMTAANHPQVGLVWDLFNMWSVHREAPEQVYKTLRKYILHVHLKDATMKDGKSQYVLTGEGDTPLAQCIRALRKGGYKGYYSFEWEKMWHPELWEPEIAIPHFAKTVRKWF